MFPDAMNAVKIAAAGDADQLKTTRRPVPVPRHDQILIRIAYAGVNRPDVLQRQGSYAPPPDASDLPGLECLIFAHRATAHTGQTIMVDTNFTNGHHLRVFD